MATIITGKNTILEAIKADHKIFELYYLKGSNSDILELANSKNIKVKDWGS